jgi:hypothetical protein
MYRVINLQELFYVMPELFWETHADDAACSNILTFPELIISTVSEQNTPHYAMLSCV